MALDNALRVTGSIDGPRLINDVGRIYPCGRGTFAKIDATITRMRAETGEPSALELVFGPLHISRGFSMVDMHRYLSDTYGVKRVIISPLIDSADHGPAYRESMISFEEEYGRYLVDLAIDSNDASRLRRTIRDLLRPQRSTLLCGLGFDILTVNASGQLYPCYTMLGKQEWKMADAAPSSSVILPLELGVRRRLREASKLAMPTCADCSLAPTCSGCPGSNVQMGLPIDEPRTFGCELQLAHMEGVLSRLIELNSDPQEWSKLQSVLAS